MVKRKGGRGRGGGKQTGEELYVHPDALSGSDVTGVGAERDRFVEGHSQRYMASQVQESMEQLHRMAGTPSSKYIHTLKTKCKTDWDACLNDPYGDGDQTPLKTHKDGQAMRDIWCTGADFYDLLQSQRLTALVNCCTMGDVNVLREILNEAKSNGEEELMHQLEQRVGVLRTTPLICCIVGSRIMTRGPSVMDHVGCVKLLLEYGARVDARDVAGHTAIHYAGGFQITPASLKILSLLLENGADPNAVNRMGACVLHSTIQCMDYKAIEMLLDAGADVDIKDLSGITPREMGKHSSKLTAMFNKGGNRREEMVDVSSSYRFGRLRGLQMLEDLGEIDDQRGFG